MAAAELFEAKAASAEADALLLRGAGAAQTGAKLFEQAVWAREIAHDLRARAAKVRAAPTRLQRYLTLEELMLGFDEDAQEALADSLRDVMDKVWYGLLTEDDRQWLNERPNKPQSCPDVTK